MSKPQTLEDFIQSFARAHGYTAKELTGKGCQKPLVEARDLAIYEAAMAYDRDQVAAAFKRLRADGLNSTQIGKLMGRHPDSLKKLADRLNQSLLNRPGEPPMRFDAVKDARFVNLLLLQGGYPVCRSSTPDASAHKVALYSQRLLELGRGRGRAA